MCHGGKKEGSRFAFEMEVSDDSQAIGMRRSQASAVGEHNSGPREELVQKEGPQVGNPGGWRGQASETSQVGG